MISILRSQPLLITVTLAIAWGQNVPTSLEGAQGNRPITAEEIDNYIKAPPSFPPEIIRQYASLRTDRDRFEALIAYAEIGYIAPGASRDHLIQLLQGTKGHMLDRTNKNIIRISLNDSLYATRFSLLLPEELRRFKDSKMRVEVEYTFSPDTNLLRSWCIRIVQ